MLGHYVSIPEWKMIEGAEPQCKMKDREKDSDDELDLLSQSHCTPSQEESDDYDFL
jgi:hypothetical protein